MAGSVDILAQLPQLESLCERLYNSQASTPPPFFHCASDHINASMQSAPDLLYIVFMCLQISLPLPLLQDAAERAQNEQVLRIFGQSTDYITACKVWSDVCRPGTPLDAVSCRTWHLLLLPHSTDLVHFTADHLGQFTVSLCPTSGIIKPAQGHHRSHAEVQHPFLYAVRQVHVPLENVMQSIYWCIHTLHGALHCSLPIKLDMRNYFMAYLDRCVSSPLPHRVSPFDNRMELRLLSFACLPFVLASAM